jgi:SAM-dependent methyltransferase
MADLQAPIATTSRIGRWIRALRAVARVQRTVEAQGAEQRAIRGAIDDLVRLHGNMLTDIAARFDAGEKHVVEVQAKGAELEADLLRLTDAQQRLAEAQERFNEIQERVNETQQRLAVSLDTMTGTLKSLGDGQRQIDIRLADFDSAQSRIEEQQQRLSEQQERLAPELPHLSRAGETDSATWLYAAFEETFRGTREQIRQRLDPYVADVRASHSATGSLPVLDVGCGRGEWLELMRTAEISARGVDENAFVVNQCHELSLDAVQRDAIAYLSEVPESSLAAITAFHVVEHLPLPRQLQLFVAAYRALAPDGIFVVETPNPENLVVGAWTFHMDPSHLRPLPPTLLRFLLEAVGFDVVDVRRLNVDDAMTQRAEQEGWAAGIRPFLCGPRDFGVVARRSRA